METKKFEMLAKKKIGKTMFIFEEHSLTDLNLEIVRKEESEYYKYIVAKKDNIFVTITQRFGVEDTSISLIGFGLSEEKIKEDEDFINNQSKNHLSLSRDISVWV